MVRPFLRADLIAPLFSPRDAIAEKARTAKTHRRLNQKRNPRKTARRMRERYDTDSYRRAIQRGSKLAGVSQWHPHQLRHNYATRVRKEYGIETARILLGHRSMVTTEVYAEADRTKAREIVAKIG